MSSIDTESDDLTPDKDDVTPDQEKPKLQLEVTVEEPSACERHITVRVSRTDVDRYLKDAFDELKLTAEVPGFRPGRAPRKIVETRFKDQIAEQVKGSLLMDSITQVTDEQDFSAISEPDFDFEAVVVPDDGPFTFEFDIEVRPEFEMPSWDHLKLKRPVRDITDEEVDRNLNNLLLRNGRVDESTEPIQTDDVVTMDLTVTHDGNRVQFEEGVTVRVRSTLTTPDAQIDDFDKKLADSKIGDRIEIPVSISGSAENESLAGKDVTLILEIKQVRRLQPATLNSDLLERLGGFESEDELRRALNGEMERQFGYRQHRQIREQITQVLTKDANWELPPDLVKKQTRRELERMILELRSSNFSDEDIQMHANALQRNSDDATRQALTEHFILERIAEENKIEADPPDYDQEIQYIAQQRNESPRRVRARLEKRGQMDTLRNQIIERKVIDLICAKADFEDVPVEDESSESDSFALDLVLSGVSDEEIPVAKPDSESEPLKQPTDYT